MYQSIINYRKARYLWVAIGLSAASLIAYIWHQPINSANGGTWLGYTLGTIGALLIVWLMLLGVRKRSYRSNLGTVQGWTSAHIYLGTALLLVATLHAGFQFGYNVHTLAYVLMVVVIVSGFYGIYTYIRYPSVMTLNRAGDSLEDLVAQLEKIDKRCVRDAQSGSLLELIQSAVDGSVIGGNWWHQLTAKDRSTLVIPSALDPERGGQIASNTDQELAIDLLAARLSQLSGGEEAARIQNLLADLAAKQTLLRRIRRDVQIRARLKIWLYLHVPITFALLAALITHIIVVFFYW